MTKKLHWTQTPEGKIKMAAAQKKAWANRTDKTEHFRRLAKLGAKAKRGPYKKTTKSKKETSLIINGWRITLGKDEVRIDND